MKKIFYFIAILFVFSASCTKKDPTPEIDQEEVGGAELIFTEVEREDHGDHADYNEIANPKVIKVKFSNDGLPEPGIHLDLEEGKSYKLQLKATDFVGREMQHTFVQRADVHQAFILNAPADALSYEYADKDTNNQSVNVGVTGYLTVLKETDKFVLRYIMRHLNPGVKAGIQASDWNNVNFAQFTGANDLDLQVEAHLVGEDGHGH